jgi:Tol biopolymer transport system component
VNPAVSAGLQAIVVKALEKDRDLRYQSGADLRVDLERVRRGQDPAPDPWPRRRRRSLQVLGLAALVAGLAFGVRACDHRIPEAAERQVTSGSGVEGDPSVSPDGRTIAFTSDEAGSKDIWIVDVKGGPAQRLTTSDASDSQPAWFPDGRSLAFSSDRRTRTQHDIWRAPILDGRAATLLVPDGESPAISPDGAMVAFVTTNASDYTRIAVAPVANPSQARVLTADRDGRWNHNEPTWSPDGKRICYAAWDGLWVVPADGGGARRLTSEESDQHPSWSPDGRHVYFVSYVDRDAAIWRVTVSTGRRTRVTRGSGVELSPDVSRDGHVLAFASESGNSDLVAFNLADRREAARFGTGKDDYWPSVGPGGREVYFAANRWGLHDIWRQLLQDGRPVGMPERVFEQTGDKSYPAVSPDGRWLAYYRLERTRPERQSRDVWLVSTSGGAPAPVATAGDSFHPAWSPDSSTLVYGSERSGAQALWTQRVVEGKLAGPPRSITPGWSHFTLFPAWSPDGSTVAFLTTHGRSNVDDLALVPAAGGPPRMVTSGADVGCVRWDPRTGYLLVAARWGGDEYELRSIRPDGSPVADDRLPLRLGREPESAKFDLSPDGRFVVSAQGKLAGHVWVMETRSRTF